MILRQNFHLSLQGSGSTDSYSGKAEFLSLDWGMARSKRHASLSTFPEPPVAPFSLRVSTRALEHSDSPQSSPVGSFGALVGAGALDLAVNHSRADQESFQSESASAFQS